MSETNSPSRHTYGLLCPVCMVVMPPTVYEGIEVNCCPQCRGIWLDQGELDKMIRSSVVIRSIEPLKNEGERRWEVVARSKFRGALPDDSEVEHG